MMNEDDKSLFTDSLSGVKVLKQPGKISKQVTNKKIVLDKAKEALRKAALGEVQNNIDALKALAPLSYAPDEVVAFKNAGVQEGVYRKLKAGSYAVEAKLDLHGFTVAEALSKSHHFIGNSYQRGLRCVLISHGKGLRQVEPAKLKNHVAIWLKNMPEVLAYHSAQPKDGGAGCVYVLLKKNEYKKLENRVRFSKLPKK
jgi:DNA-nicking Smr family endonuclease